MRNLENTKNFNLFYNSLFEIVIAIFKIQFLENTKAILT